MPDEPGADAARLHASPRAVRALRAGSAVVVLGVVLSAAVVAGELWRSVSATALALAQVAALWWAVRRPAAVLAATALTGCALWLVLPAVGLTGALLAAQIALCVLSSLAEPRVSRHGLFAMLLLAPTAFARGGAVDLVTYALAVTLAWTGGQWRRAQRNRLVAEARRAAAEERARIHREVHDVVAHTVSVMVVQAAAAEDVFDRDPERARQALRAIDEAGRSAMGELRLLLRAGHREGDGGDGLVHPRDLEPPRGLTDLAELTARAGAAGLTVELDAPEPTRPLPPAGVQLTAYRIVQEALTNTLRHAAATRVRVRVRHTPAALHVTVTDDGRPLTRRAGPAGAGRGLLGMRERAALLGGSLRAGPCADGGFEVHAVLPIESGP